MNLSAALYQVLCAYREMFGAEEFEQMLMVHVTKSAMVDDEIYDQDTDRCVSLLAAQEERRNGLVKLLTDGFSVSDNGFQKSDKFAPGQGITHSAALAVKFSKASQPPGSFSPKTHKTMRSVELRSMMLDALSRTQLIDCKARKDRDQAFDQFMSQLKEMKDVKERSRHQDKQSEKKLREIKESMAKDGLLSLVGEKPEHRMKVEESTVDIFRAERIQFFWATVTIYLMSFYGWVPSHQDSLIIVPNEGSGARLKTCEAPELPKHGSSTIEWYAIIKEIVGTDNFISGFELSEYTFRKGTVTSSVKELLVTVMPKEVSEEAINEAFQRVKLAETNERENADDFLTPKEWEKVMARAYRDRDEGHDVDIEGLEATMQEQLDLDKTDL